MKALLQRIVFSKKSFHQFQCLSLRTIASESNTDIKKPLYVLPMFPYPSGNLHMGHVRVYSISDCLNRYYTLQGYDVLHTIGWDAFGLPAENAARDRGVDPKEWTIKNIAQMKQQLQKLNIDFDWSKEINTSSPEYYKWTQWLFLKLYKRGLIHYINAPVYYDPVDKTVLADEQVDSAGNSWRSGAKAELMVMKQWYINISNYSDELYDGIQELTGWPEVIKQLQRNWIGKQKGLMVKFDYEMGSSLYKNIIPISRKTSGKSCSLSPTIDIFTAKPEELLGTQFICVSPLHPIVDYCKSISKDIKEYIEKDSLLMSTRSYGVKSNDILTCPLPISLRNPLDNSLIPVIMTNTVIADYKLNIKLGIPAGNEVDKKIADQYSLPLLSLYQPTETGSIINIPGLYQNLPVMKCRQQIVQDLKEKNRGNPYNYARLRDWSVSRQRYWGAPIPMVICDKCGIVPVPEDQLPVTLPEGKPEIPMGKEDEYLTPLEHYSNWTRCTCPKCGARARRDGNTLDTFLDSSWYYLRYVDPHNSKEIWNTNKMKYYNGQVDHYVGGIEHSVGHLLYSRFIRLFLEKEGLLPRGSPYKRIYSQGMVLGPTYIDKQTGEYIRREHVEKKGEQYFNNENGRELSREMLKMSKSKYNGVDPLEVLEKYGSDAVRFGILFKCPLANDFPWENDVCEIAGRFKEKVNTVIKRLNTTSNVNMSNTEDRIYI
ncbi:hypothetical protein WA158_003239 [Blastocystis sp. Blastoise]